MVATHEHNLGIDVGLVQQVAADLSDEIDRRSGRTSAIDAQRLSLPRIHISTEELLRKPVEQRLEIIGQKLGAGHRGAFGVEVGCKDLSYSVMVPKQRGNDEHESVLTFFKSMATLPGMSQTQKLEEKQILKGITCDLRPGTMTLVCGPPGCGKTSFMRALAGQIPSISGDITYNGDKRAKPGGTFLPRNFLAYVEQRDHHIPNLTVRQTFEFACKLRSPSDMHAAAGRARISDVSEGGAFHYKSKVEGVAAALGLTGCLDTVVGNEMLRGISGGQKKRVTLGEMLLCDQCVNFMDEISNGLDSQTAYDIVKAAKIAGKIFGLTQVISLLQPPPDVYEMFDTVIILDEGSVIYNGPRLQLMPYFNSLGYNCPVGKDLGDFCQELTVEPNLYKDMEMSMGVRNQPSTSQQFAQCFALSEIHRQQEEAVGALIKAEMTGAGVQVTRREENEAGEEVLRLVTAPEFSFDVQDELVHTQKYRKPMSAEIGIVFEREFTILCGNKKYLVSRLFSSVVAALLLGSLFFNLPTTFQGNYNRMGFFFGALMSQSLAGLAQIPVDFETKQVFIKQRDSGFYRTLSFLSAQAVSQGILNLMCNFLFCVISYSMVGMSDVGMSDKIEDFILFLLIIFSLATAMSQFFKMLVGICQSTAFAMFLGIFFIVVSALTCGFFVPEESLGWWIWFYYWNPIAYAFSSLTIVEFGSYEHGAGLNFLTSMGQRSGEMWKWYGIIFLFGFNIATLIVTTIGYAYSKISVGVASSKSSSSDERDQSLLKVVTDPAMSEVNLAVTEDARIPFQAVTMTWQSVSYSVPNTTKGEQDIQLLDSITGGLQPGTMMALMGTSGAGKTTLLDVLAGRKTTGKITGDICLNGHPIDYSDNSFARASGYCEQMDMHTPTATVREALNFSAYLRLPPSMSQEQKDHFVVEVMETLELTSLANCLAQTLSMEQAKRLTIGVELVASPSIIFLDEPTSGLDGHAAAIVLRVLKKVVKSGRSVICTIHQPGISLFSQFDSLLFLKRGGQTVFFGDLGESCENLIAYFEVTRGCPELKPMANPADWMLRVVDDETTDHAAVYKDSDEAMRTTEQVGRQRSEMAGVHERLHFDSAYACSSWEQLILVYRKTSLHYYRLPSYTGVKLVQGIIFALIVSSLCVQKSWDNKFNIRSVAAMIMMGTFMLASANMAVASTVVMQARAVYYRERACKMYQPFVYCISWILAEVPYSIGQALLFTVIFYFMVGLNQNVGDFFWCFAAFLLFGSFGTTIGHFLGATLPSQAVASALSSLINMFFVMFAGFSIPFDSMPAGWKFAYYLFPTHYPLELIYATQFDDHKSLIVQDLTLSANGTETCDAMCGATADASSALLMCRPAGACTAYGYMFDTVAAGYVNDPGMDLGVLIFFLVAFRVFTVVGFAYVNHMKR